jgi:hypothetical protein
MPATKPKLTEFTITVRDNYGKLHQWGLRAYDLEDAARRAVKKVCMKRATAKRTTGNEGEPGWFYPHIEGPFPFGGNGYKVEPKGAE